MDLKKSKYQIQRAIRADWKVRIDHLDKAEMAPKRRPTNVVRSGNAGNSSKPKPIAEPATAAEAAAAGPPRPPPLFPTGYKTPVTILNEKCQKNGWERPIVDARPNGDKWTGAVTLQKRVSKNVYDLEKVRLEVRPPLEIATSQEAKHWAATYALFRVRTRCHKASWLRNDSS